MMGFRFAMVPGPEDPKRILSSFTRRAVDALEKRGHIHLPAPTGLLRLLRWAASTDAEIVHFHWPNLLYAPRAAQDQLPADRFRPIVFMALLALCRRRGIRLVWSVHDLYPHPQTPLRHERMEWFMRRLLFKTADSVVVMGDSALPEVVNEFGQPNRAVVAPLGSFREFYPEGTDRETARRSLGIRDNETMLLFFGAMHRNRNPVRLAEMVRAVPSLPLRLVCVSAFSDDAVRRRMEKCAEIDPRISVRFAGVDAADAEVYFKAADVVAVPGNFYLTSGVVITAVSFGIPVLTARYGCAIDQVGDAGILYDMYDPQGLRRALGLTLASRLDVLRARAEKAASRFSWDEHASQLELAYQ